jgi:hypothetical protein
MKERNLWATENKQTENKTSVRLEQREDDTMS